MEAAVRNSRSPAISLIIPAYNVENYLTECIAGIRAQIFSDYEVLLIDDGSTDMTPALCDKFSSEDERIRVIHQKNGGVSMARNRGLDEALGEYIVFADADDSGKPSAHAGFRFMIPQTSSTVILLFGTSRMTSSCT